MTESFPEREERILKKWSEEKTFEASMEARRGGEVFTFYDGPPFATGLPHYGHLLAGTIKDVMPRYKTMQGFFVDRRFGWDCHGLPVENEIEKAKELSGATSIEHFGIAEFNEECRSIVLRYTKEWEHSVKRMGRWVSFDHTYRTMDRSFMESVWWVFSELYKKGLVYEGFKVMPFSTKLGTPLSNFEANLNYKEVDDPSVTVKLELKEEPGTYLLIWTTTPWTLPSNLAVMVHRDLDYVKVSQKGETFIVAKAALSRYFKQEFEIIGEMKGSDLIGKRYTPILPYFENEDAFRIIEEVSVSPDEGTGLVHSAPAFGEVDFYACSNEGITPVNPVDHNGKFTKEVSDFEGMYVKDADREILKRLKGEGKVFHHGQVRHRYPFCWRSDTPLIYKAVRTWFVAVEKVKEQMIANNQKITWVPEHIKQGRFGKWLENARDWAISRNRYWGTPIPLWRSDDGELLCISSVKELEEKTGRTFDDLHRHFIDDVTIEHNGKTFHRISEVFDCWFESGSMPYAQDHYPFENQDKTFSADFIAEGLDQTRGWFYTLTVLSTILFNQPAFKNVIVNGLILAEDGQKMSKRLKNYPEPTAVINKCGADAIRFYLLSSPAVHAEDLKFSERGVELVLRQVLIPLWNSLMFFQTYTNIYKWTPSEETATAEIDQWILSQLQKLTGEMTEALDTYKLNQATTPLIAFIDQLTNWYIRRSRSRFWADEDSPDRRQAFSTLYKVLTTLSKLIAPFTPFLAEALYLELQPEKSSVHLCDYPKVDGTLRNTKLEEEMARAQTAVSLGHALRKEHKLKVRQPLGTAYLISSDENTLNSLRAKEHLIADELNVKNIIFESDESKFVTVVIKPNFRVLGKKVGKAMPQAKQAISELSDAAKKQLADGNPINMTCGDAEITLTSEDIEVAREVKEGLIASTAEGVVIALDTTLTESLKIEGLARELVNRINTLRKEKGLEVTDRIQLSIQETPSIKSAFEAHRDYICHETLTTAVDFTCSSGSEVELDGQTVTMNLAKA